MPSGNTQVLWNRSCFNRHPRGRVERFREISRAQGYRAVTGQASDPDGLGLDPRLLTMSSTMRGE